MLTDRFGEALVLAHELHRAQRRKGTEIPYVSHLLSVSALVLEHGGDEDQAIAALLHDAAEDQGGAGTLAVIRQRFGDGVADIVSDCTDSWEEPKPDWRARKEAYIADLAMKPTRSLLVRWPTRPIMPRRSCTTIANSAIPCGAASPAGPWAHAGTTATWLTVSPTWFPVGCRNGLTGRCAGSGAERASRDPGPA